MCPKPIFTGLVLSSIVFATASAQAQVIVDVSKITCDQYVHAKITTPNLIAAWLIPNPIDQNPWAHWRSPMDMMRQG